MRLSWPQDAATDRVPSAGVARRRSRLGAGAIRVLSVTAVAATTCTVWAGVASAATAHTTKHASTISVSVSPKTAFVYEAVKLSATVKSSGKTPTGKVTFKIGSFKLCAAKLSHGKASCRIGLGPAGTYKVRGYYSGDATHKASTSGAVKLTEVRASTTTAITNSDPGAIAVGGTFTFDVTVTAQTGAPAASGSVVVAPTFPTGLPAAYSCTATVTNGKGSCSVTPPEYGIDDYAATFAGNIADDGSAYAGPFALEVQNVTSTTAGPATAAAGTVALTADVDAMGANITDGTGSVAFYIGTSATAEPTLVSGCAAEALTTFDAPDNVATCDDTLAAGDYWITVKFSGDDVNEPSNSEPTEIVVS